MSAIRLWSNGRGGAGFTLLEILIAFTILMLALGVLLSAFSNGLRSVDASAAHVTAMMQARSIVDRVGLEIPLEDGEVSGMAEGSSNWVLRIRRQELVDAARTGAEERLPVVLVEVEVSVSGGGGRALVLKTLRLAPLQ